MKKIFNFIFQRLFFFGFAIVVQVGFLFIQVWRLSNYSKPINLLLNLFAISMVLYIVNKWDNPSFKLAWIILILVVPIFGIVIYVVFGRSNIAKKMEEKFEQVGEGFQEACENDPEVVRHLEAENIQMARQSNYISNMAKIPLQTNTYTEYFKIGEEMFDSMVEKLKSAKHFIFMEYFIIAEGVMWNTILEILEEKAKEGVDVRLIYDDMGCIGTLPSRYYKELQSKGIKCAAFNPFRPFMSVVYNNRNHRKIMVIDGYIGYTGGINLADEYINQLERFGHWKDTGVMLMGEGVWNFTLMFLQMWETITNMKDDKEKFRPSCHHSEPFSYSGYVQPFSDTPLDHEPVGENVYMNLIQNAKRYVYIFTPYLIIDNEMMTALCVASKKGVDVRIVTPGIPDKKIVFLLTQSYYPQLIRSGVKIYEYTPGFIHAKSMVCDDEVAVVGTINLDYRSLYLHFECGVWMYRTKAVLQVKADALDTFQKCRLITEKQAKRKDVFVRLYQSILRVFAPML